MTARAIRLAVWGVAAGLVWGAAALHGDDAEQGVDVGQVPASVTEAAAKAVEGFKAESAVVEAVLIYEVEGEAGEREWELEITAEGTIIEQEEEEDEAAEGRDTDDADETQVEGNDADGDAEEGDDDEAEEEDGAEHELAVPVSALPAAVVEAARKAVEGIELEEGAVESVLVYELSGTADGRRVEIEITSEGDVLEIERE